MLLLLLPAAPTPGQDTRDATRLEVGERYCFRSPVCLNAVRRDVAANRPIQWVVFTLSQLIYDGKPDNAERAYDAAIRAITFANDFLSDAELSAGQTTYAGANAAALRQIFNRYTIACENKRNWLAKHQCMTRKLFPLLPEQYRPVLVPLE